MDDLGTRGHRGRPVKATVLVGAVLAAALVAACSPDKPFAAPSASRVSAPPPDPTRVSFADDFESEPSERWEPISPSAWRWDRTEGIYELTKNVPLAESVRAPFNRNLVKDVEVGDFQLDVDLKSTTRDYPNQSLCLFFGYGDPEHMYYVHFGREASETSNQIFLVNGTDRTPISTATTPGTPWDDAWHHARVTRDVATGEIKVFFDDMTEPVMTATDTTMPTGQIGIGSFDDTGQFDNVVIRGKSAAK